jgi:hypothetical protein
VSDDVAHRAVSITLFNVKQTSIHDAHLRCRMPIATIRGEYDVKKEEPSKPVASVLGENGP